MFKQNIALSPGAEAFSSHLIEVIIMLLGAAILGFIIGWLFRKSYKQEFFAMKADHDLCPGIKAGLEQIIRDLKADLEKSRELISDITIEKEGLLADLNIKISNLDMANNKIATKETEIKELKDKLVSLQALSDKNILSLQALESANLSLGAEIKQLSEKLSKTGPEFTGTAPGGSGVG